MTFLTNIFTWIIQQSLFGVVFFILLFVFLQLGKGLLSFRARSLLMSSYFLLLLLPVHLILQRTLADKGVANELFVALSDVSTANVFRNSVQRGVESVDHSWFAGLWALGAISSLMMFVIIPLWRQRQRECQWQAHQALPSFVQEKRLKESILVCWSSGVQSPFVSGVFRPKILLPSHLNDLHPLQSKAIILHEVAHVIHKDLLALLVARIVTCLFWFVPVNYLVYWLLRQFQESSADEYVLREMGEEVKRPYAKALAQLAVAPHQSLSMSLHMSFLNRHDVTRRLRMIQKFKSTKKFSAFLPVTMLALASTLALAATQKDRPQTQYFVKFNVYKNGELRAQPRMVTMEGEEAEITIVNGDEVENLKINLKNGQSDLVDVSVNYCLEGMRAEWNNMPPRDRERLCLEKVEQNLRATMDQEFALRGVGDQEYRMHIEKYEGDK